MRVVVALVGAASLASATPIDGRTFVPRSVDTCSTAESTTPPGSGLADIAVADSEAAASWTPVDEIASSLQLIHARAIRNTEPEGTIQVQYAFTKTKKGTISYDWSIYMTNSSDTYPTSDKFTLVRVETQAVDDIFLGVVSFCINDTGGQRLRVGVSHE